MKWILISLMTSSRVFLTSRYRRRDREWVVNASSHFPLLIWSVRLLPVKHVPCTALEAFGVPMVMLSVVMQLRAPLQSN